MTDARLISAGHNLPTRTFPLHSPQIIVGRDHERCQIVVEHSRVGRIHAAIETGADGARFLRDLESANGTFLNGQRLRSRKQLQHGDRIEFADSSVAFIFEDTHSSETPAPRHHRTPTKSRDASWQSGTRGMSIRQQGWPHAIRIGREQDNDLVLAGDSVSRNHATVRFGPQASPVLEDNQSTNGTWVNGRRLLRPTPINAADLIQIGGFVLTIESTRILARDLAASSISATKLRTEINGRVLVHDVSVAVEPGEFVGLMGPSGCGKSTLLNALCGLRPATYGTVRINDLDLYRNLGSLRRALGYVPQRDVLHECLTVEETLRYGALLRLPPGSPNAIDEAVAEVAKLVALESHLTTPFRRLSGGQQKRASLALELITKPKLIFLDEPTSPLDPLTSEDMMLLFRKLADEGRIVVAVTHKFECFEQMHLVAVLTEGGRLAFLGPPRRALTYFACNQPSDIYRRIGEQAPGRVQQRFLESPEYREFLATRLEAASPPTDNEAGASRVFVAQTSPAGCRQMWTLIRRFASVKLADKRNALVLLLQAPLIGLLLSFITSNSANDAKTLFIVCVVSIWIGANSSIREVVGEAPIYSRERLTVLKIPSYVLSKVTVLGLLGAVQAGGLVSVLCALGRLRPPDGLLLVGLVWLIVLGGIALGLLVSSVVDSSEKALSLLPLLVIPQLLLGGFLKPMDTLYLENGRAVSKARYESGLEGRRTGDGECIALTRYEGLDRMSALAAPVQARWAMDVLSHVVSMRDRDARVSLPAYVSVAAYGSDVNSDGTMSSVAAQRYMRRVTYDLGLLAAFVVFPIAGTILAMARKDARR